MLSPKLTRWADRALLGDGVLWLVYALVTLRFAPSYWAAYRPIDYLAVDLYSAGLLLLGLGLIGIHARQATSAGPEELVGFIAAFVGAVLAGIGDFGEDGLHLALAGQLGWLPGMLALAIGLVLFCVGTLRAKVLPRWCGVLLALSPIVGFLLGGLGSNWQGTLLFSLIWIALGGFLVVDQGDSIRQRG